jgi:hypothetical protein
MAGGGSTRSARGCRADMGFRAEAILAEITAAKYHVPILHPGLIPEPQLIERARHIDSLSTAR